MALSSEELERLADHLLRTELENNKKNKSKSAEFPFLSDSQMKRRTLMEIPYSNLSEKQRLECKTKNLDYYPKEVE